MINKRARRRAEPDSRSGGSPIKARPTSANGAIAHIARLTGARVALDAVGADGVPVTGLLAAGTLILLYNEKNKVNV